jgi:hypothetical protein
VSLRIGYHLNPYFNDDDNQRNGKRRDDDVVEVLALCSDKNCSMLAEYGTK